MNSAAKTEKTKTDFNPFKVGTVFNNLKSTPKNLSNKYSKVIIKYPSRLEAMAIDPSKIAQNNNLKYTPGQVNFCVKIFKTISIEKTRTARNIIISQKSKRSPLIRHAAEIMKKALGFHDGLSINVKDDVNLRHCGLGSSSGLIAGVACAINELYGCPIDNRSLVKYLAQNHGEEIDGEENLINPVQCIGGSAACGTHNGGLVIIAGESVVVKTMDISNHYDVVFGIPSGFTYPDSGYLMNKEKENLHKFLRCGEQYGPTIAYKLFHECFPDIEEGGLTAIGNLIFEYRFHMGSIKNCSFVYPPIVEISQSLAYLKEKGIADVLTISSVGPGIFAITKHPDTCEQAFIEKGMNTFRTKIHNGRYEILEII